MANRFTVQKTGKTTYKVMDALEKRVYYSTRSQRKAYGACDYANRMEKNHPGCSPGPYDLALKLGEMFLG